MSQSSESVLSLLSIDTTTAMTTGVCNIPATGTTHAVFTFVDDSTLLYFTGDVSPVGECDRACRLKPSWSKTLLWRPGVHVVVQC